MSFFLLTNTFFYDITNIQGIYTSLDMSKTPRILDPNSRY